MSNKILDMTPEEERELIELTEKEDGWISSPDIEKDRAFWMEAAKRTLDGERQRISISIPKRDLARLKAKAAEEGMPYQTLINSILHKYVG
ncbi:MAG: DNA-binding protein [Mesorhizobium sp.]|nr:DNA-binding protein [Mesorhizobium sp.]